MGLLKNMGNSAAKIEFLLAAIRNEVGYEGICLAATCLGATAKYESSQENEILDELIINADLDQLPTYFSFVDLRILKRKVGPLLVELFRKKQKATQDPNHSVAQYLFYATELKHLLTVLNLYTACTWTDWIGLDYLIDACRPQELSELVESLQHYSKENDRLDIYIQSIVNEIGDIGGDEALYALANVVSNDNMDRMVRYSALGYIAEIGGQEVLCAVLNDLNGDDPWVCLVASMLVRPKWLDDMLSEQRTQM